MQEIWKDIRGYEGLYQISNFGRVKRLMFINKTTYKQQERFLTLTDNGNGYKIAGLSKDNKRKNFYVHRLVAEYFIENPQKYEHVNHLDYNRANNNINNLEWITIKDNINYSADNRAKVKHIVKKIKSKYGKYIGYREKDKTFRVFIPIDGKVKEFSGFKTLQEAINKRNEYYNPDN